MLESYQDLKKELNKRLNIITKKYEEKKEKNSDLFGSSNSHKKSKNSKKDNNNNYEDEEINLNNNIKLSSDDNSYGLDAEFANSEKQLSDSSKNFIFKICKEKCCLFCLIIILFVFGFYVIFLKKNNSSENS